jgi:hypothetical protein
MMTLVAYYISWSKQLDELPKSRHRMASIDARS